MNSVDQNYTQKTKYVKLFDGINSNFILGVPGEPGQSGPPGQIGQRGPSGSPGKKTT